MHGQNEILPVAETAQAVDRAVILVPMNTTRMPTTSIAKNAPATAALLFCSASLMGLQRAIMIIARTPKIRTDMETLRADFGTFLPDDLERLMSMKTTRAAMISTNGIAMNVSMWLSIGGTHDQYQSIMTDI